MTELLAAIAIMFFCFSIVLLKEVAKLNASINELAKKLMERLDESL